METINTNSTSQNQAYESICEKLKNIIKTDMVWDNEISLSGAAGTGKTYLTTKLVKKLKEKFHITITAPTHKALQVLRENLLADEIDSVETKTLQSFLNLRLVTDYDKVVQKFELIKNSKDKDMMFRLLYVAITRASTNIKVLLSTNEDMTLIDAQNYVMNSIDSQFDMFGMDWFFIYRQNMYIEDYIITY